MLRNRLQSRKSTCAPKSPRDLQTLCELFRIHREGYCENEKYLVIVCSQLENGFAKNNFSLLPCKNLCIYRVVQTVTGSAAAVYNSLAYVFEFCCRIAPSIYRYRYQASITNVTMMHKVNGLHASSFQ